MRAAASLRRRPATLSRSMAVAVLRSSAFCASAGNCVDRSWKTVSSSCSVPSGACRHHFRNHVAPAFGRVPHRRDRFRGMAAARIASPSRLFPAHLEARSVRQASGPASRKRRRVQKRHNCDDEKYAHYAPESYSATLWPSCSASVDLARSGTAIPAASSGCLSCSSPARRTRWSDCCWRRRASLRSAR